jgi:ankyrin repeat protein
MDNLKKTLSEQAEEISKKNNYELKFLDFITAISANNEEDTAKFLQENSEFAETKFKNGFYPIHHVCSVGSEKSAAIIIDFFPNAINQRLEQNDKFWYPIHIAAKNGHTQIVKTLIENGADINQLDSFGSTALKYALSNNQLDCSSEILKNSECSVNLDYEVANSPIKMTILHYAINRNLYDLAEKIIIEKNSDVTKNYFDEKGNEVEIMKFCQGKPEFEKLITIAKVAEVASKCASQAVKNAKAETLVQLTKQRG